MITSGQKTKDASEKESELGRLGLLHCRRERGGGLLLPTWVEAMSI